MSQYTVLRVDASMNRQGSTSRMLAARLADHLVEKHQGKLLVRDLAEGVPFIDEAWIDANFTDPEDRTEIQRQALAVSDALVAELQEADQLVIGVPIYNFGPPAAFKAWIDMVARARETFRYTERGPVGLLDIDHAYLIVSSGGTPVGSEMDYVTSYTQLLLGFLGIDKLEVIPCEGLMTEGEEVLERALSKIDQL